MDAIECNFDGLVGPTHNYAGLSHGNIASESNRASVSNPRKAALQGLAKAWALAGRGYSQAILPPHERPSLEALRDWGITGRDDTAILERAASTAPHLLAAAASASAMWTANACTVSPSADTEDGLAHFTPANLLANLHRSIEAPFTHRLLQTLFDPVENAVVHPPLSGGTAMADEGAANHTRLGGTVNGNGLHLFVFGRSALDSGRPAPARFPGRQTLESVQAIARRHRLPESAVLILQQNPEAIDAGVFHNDVISVGHGDTLILHEKAFLDPDQAKALIMERFTALTGQAIRLVEVRESEVSLGEAVRTYLFNSQLLPDGNGGLLLVAPGECRQSDPVSRLLDAWMADPDNPVTNVLSFDLRESMRNGGGPACLRQRIVLTEPERTAIAGRLFLDAALHTDLVEWINRHYREELHPRDLADPQLLIESRTALDELTRILELPALYAFQRD